MMRSISIVVACCAIVGCGAQTGRDVDTGNAEARAADATTAAAPRDTSSRAPVAGSVQPGRGGSVESTSVRTLPVPAPPSTSPQEPGHATLVGVRAARQPGFERIVFEFADRVPRHEVKLVTDPAQCGSGDPVTVSGSTTLVARFRSTVAHRFEGERPIVTVPARDIAPALPQVKQLKQICDFEGEVEWVIGLAERRPFTVSTLAAPPRIVIDIR